MKRADFCDAVHCCKSMTNSVDDYRIPIDFDPDGNRYFIPLMWPHGGSQGFWYCPWCGVKLPEQIEIDVD